MKHFYSSFFQLMLKKTKLFSLIFVGLLATTNYLKAQTTFTYCPAAAVYTADDEIFQVSFATMTNTSNCTSIGAAGSTISLYNDYTTLVPAPAVSLGSTYPLSVTVGMCGLTSYSGIVRVWIDYNQNGLFTDAGEEVYTSAYGAFAVAGTTVSAAGGITIPFSAVPGTTRMRVIETESSVAPTPCTNPLWGEVEDYNIIILAPSPLDLGVYSVLKPTNFNKCFGIDTIVARVRNYGSAAVDFALHPAIIKVKTTGPVVATYSLALTSGSLASTAMQDFTISTAFNMSSLGVYKLKGYTTVVGDGSTLNDTVVSLVTRAPYFTKTVSPNDTNCFGVPVTINVDYSPKYKVGNGSVTNTAYSYPAPYGNYYWGAKHQFLYLASELTAAGVVPGNISSLSFQVTNTNSSANLSNLNLSMASTTLTSLSTFSTGLISVYTSSFAPTVGLNTHTLTTPYLWDGVSNILVETCFNNTTATTNASVKQSITTFTSSLYYRANAATVCASPGVETLSTQRPDISFGQPVATTYSWTPSIGLSSTTAPSTTVNISTSQTYTVTSNISGCTSYDTIHIQIKPTPTPNLGHDTIVCLLPFSLSANTTANSFLWSNGLATSTISIPTTGKYWVRGTNTNGCTKTDTILVTLGVIPVVTLGSDTAFCSGKSVTLYAGNPGSSYLWNTGATTPTLSVNTVGSYSVVVTNSLSCKASDIINISTKPSPSVSLVLTGSTIFCPNTTTPRPLTEGSPSGGIYIGSGVSGNNFTPSLAGQGTYIIYYNYTAPNGCSNLGQDTLFVNACVGIDELANNFGLNVYPNPTSGLFTVEINSNENINALISVTSIDGKIVYEDKVNGNEFASKSVNISDLASGIYYLTVNSKDAKRTFKVLKQ